MRDVTITIESMTPYSASKNVPAFDVAKLKGETRDDYEKRVWRDKAHVDEAGAVYIPGVSFKLAIDETAKILKERIPGKGNQEYGGVFATGVVAMGEVNLGIKKADLRSVEIFAHANGRRGPGTRVPRFFPIVYQWSGTLAMRVFNDAIPADVFERFFEQAGLLAGVGRGRPITGSPAGNGRFRPVSFAWS